MKYMGRSKAYKILGVKNYASNKEIKKAFHKEAKKYHPDKCKLAAEKCLDKMTKLNEAYKYLDNGRNKDNENNLSVFSKVTQEFDDWYNWFEALDKMTDDEMNEVLYEHRCEIFLTSSAIPFIIGAYSGVGIYATAAYYALASNSPSIIAMVSGGLIAHASNSPSILAKAATDLGIVGVGMAVMGYCSEKYSVDEL